MYQIPYMILASGNSLGQLTGSDYLYDNINHSAADQSITR